jgi:hypothetical protein
MAWLRASHCRILVIATATGPRTTLLDCHTDDEVTLDESKELQFNGTERVKYSSTAELRLNGQL